MEYKVVEKESMKIVAMTREFPAETGSQEVPEFWKEYYANGFAEKVCGMMGICIGNDQGQGKWAIAPHQNTAAKSGFRSEKNIKVKDLV